MNREQVIELLGHNPQWGWTHIVDTQQKYQKYLDAVQQTSIIKNKITDLQTEYDNAGRGKKNKITREINSLKETLENLNVDLKVDFVQPKDPETIYYNIVKHVKALHNIHRDNVEEFKEKLNKSGNFSYELQWGMESLVVSEAVVVKLSHCLTLLNENKHNLDSVFKIINHLYEQSLKTVATVYSTDKLVLDIYQTIDKKAPEMACKIILNNLFDNWNDPLHIPKRLEEYKKAWEMHILLQVRDW